MVSPGNTVLPNAAETVWIRRVPYGRQAGRDSYRSNLATPPIFESVSRALIVLA